MKELKCPKCNGKLGFKEMFTAFSFYDIVELEDGVLKVKFNKDDYFKKNGYDILACKKCKFEMEPHEMVNKGIYTEELTDLEIEFISERNDSSIW